ncbi:MAG: hypothetical protein U0Q22_01180 [Acidimicrobiales bacterium]
MNTRTSRRRLQIAALAAATVVVATACPPDAGPGVPAAPTVYLQPQNNNGYFSMPWPNDLRRNANGMTDWTGLPGINTDILTEPLPKFPILPSIVEKGQTTVNEFGRNSAVYFQANVEIAPASLPTAAQSTQPSGSVVLMNLDTGVPAPIVVVNQERADRFRPAHLLTLLPYPGHPLDNDARYAAIVFDDVTSTAGDPLTPSPTLAQLDAPYDASMPMTAAQHAALAAQYADVKAAIAAHTTHAVGDLVAFTEYRTQNTNRDWDAIVSAAADLPTPTINVTSVDACSTSWDPGGNSARVLATVTLPVWRNGTFPYLFDGGRVVVQPNGKAQQFGTRVAPVELLVPCTSSPAGGWPVVTHVDGTGGDQHVDSSPVVRHKSVLYGQIAPLYGDGVGDAGTILAPFGFDTLREQEEVLFYNLLNPDAIRSNPLQQAADHLLFTHAVEQFSLAGSTVGQPGIVHADPTKVVITGHSQGAQTLAMVAHADPGISGVVSSAGSGGQYHTLAHSPRRLSTISLVTNSADRLDELNPLIQVVQTVFESSDGANFTNDTNFLNYTNYDDTCTTVETGTHYSTAQHLAMVANAPEISYGDPSLDRVPALLPIAGNVNGKTRVSVLNPGGHYNYLYNIDRSTAFVTQIFAGVTPVLPPQSYGYSSANCPGERYDDPPRLFGI